jgi:hypothetical protein
MNFMKYVETNSVRIPFSGCSIWLGAQTNGGYGRSAVANRIHNTTIVHKAVFQEIHGQVPSGMYVCHHCDTPSCVNVDHLFIGTPKANAQDRKQKNRSASKRGELNGNSILTSADVFQIIKLIGEKNPLVSIANKYGVSHATICAIKNKRAWRSI